MHAWELQIIAKTPLSQTERNGIWIIVRLSAPFENIALYSKIEFDLFPWIVIEE